MGVTLERVQNKFACIIGELCSEPVVLSQFAIWLDLRLAEYKAKGAISLDCSGDSPEPIWMNGHRLPPARPMGREITLSKQSPMGHRNSSPQQSIGRLRHFPSATTVQRQSSESGLVDDGATASVIDRLSPDVLVKEEPSGGGESSVFPISLHHHEGTDSSQSILRESRKRTATETVSSGYSSQTDNNFSHPQSPASVSPLKHRRLHSSSGEETPPAAIDSTSNQSLMSIISAGGIQDQTAETVDLTDSDINIIMDYEDTQKVDDSFSSPQPSSSAGGGQAANTVRKHVGESLSSPIPVGGEWHSQISYDPTQNVPDRLTPQSVLKRLDQTKERSHQIAMNIASSVSALERWWWATYGEERNMEDMPPADLDRYLAEFLPILKRPTGEEYSPESLTNFRSLLDRFLKDHKYPYSISKSLEFFNSQQAFSTKRRTLISQRRDKNCL